MLTPMPDISAIPSLRARSLCFLARQIKSPSYQTLRPELKAVSLCMFLSKPGEFGQDIKRVDREELDAALDAVSAESQDVLDALNEKMGEIEDHRCGEAKRRMCLMGCAGVAAVAALIWAPSLLLGMPIVAGFAWAMWHLHTTAPSFEHTHGRLLVLHRDLGKATVEAMADLAGREGL
jgi:hypothetical protein